MTNTSHPQDLEGMAEAITAAVRQRGGELPPIPVFSIYLAQYFGYNVTKGGFAQLLYNLRGEHLGEIEQMLIDAPAPVAHVHYTRAVQACLADIDTYQKFLTSEYTSANSLKDALHSVSIEYFNSGVDFSVEIRDFILRSTGPVHEWLNTSAED